MAPTIQDTMDQRHVEPAGAGLRETRFERSPWKTIRHSQEGPFPVTMWIGFKALVVAVSMPGVDPDPLRLSVRGTCLSLRDPSENSLFSKDIELPYTVDVPPIQFKDGNGTLYILLQKK